VGERRSALIVATDRYDAPALSQLAAPAADAEALAEVLGDTALGGFDVEVLHNATSSVIAQRVEGLLRDRKPSDLVLLHFSCHGLKDESGELFLAATNTSPSLLVSTAVDAAIVSRLIRRTRAGRVVLMLDCCYGGAFEQGSIPRAAGDVDVRSQFAQAELGGGRGRAIITASSAMEYAFEGSRLADTVAPQPSVFTGALVEGIRTGDADRDQDGYVSLGELYDFVFDRVRSSTPHQTPCKWEFDLQGDLHITRNPRRRVLPGQLPEDLQALISSPVTAARLGAVAELAHLAEGDDLRTAAAAHAALVQMGGDDSRRVSLAAQEHAARCEPRLPQGPVDLGRGRVGGPPLVLDLPVQGSPLARMSAVSTTGSGLRATLEAGRLRITASTAESGRVAGRVTLSGAAGEAFVDVTGSVAPVKVAAPREPPTPRERATATAPLPHVDAPRTTPREPAAASPPPRQHTSEPDLADLPAPRRAWWSARSALTAAAVVLVAGVAVLIGSNAGGDDPELPRTWQVTVDGTVDYTDTGVDLPAGRQVSIVAEGEVFHNESASTGPEGFPNRPDLLTPVPSENHNALIGRIGPTGEPFLVGRSTSFTTPTAGRLLLGINDGGLENNRGSFEAVVTVDPAS
jgi:hypothetical protein